MNGNRNQKVIILFIIFATFSFISIAQIQESIVNEYELEDLLTQYTSELYRDCYVIQLDCNPITNNCIVELKDISNNIIIIKANCDLNDKTCNILSSEYQQ